MKAAARTSAMYAIGLAGLTLAALARTFDDFPVADCFSLLIKARELSLGEILSPDQTAVINPYWRPLFVLFLKVAEAWAGPAPLLQHLLSSAAHAATTVLAWLLGRQLLGPRPALVLGAALFALSPVTVDTVAWTTVAYAVLSGLFATATLLLALRWLASPSPLSILLPVGSAALGLMASQSPYALIPILVLYSLLFARDRQRIASLRAAGALVTLLALLVLVHYFVFEKRISADHFGPAPSTPLGLLSRLVATIPRFTGALLALPELPMVWWLIALAAIAALTLALLGRAGFFLFLAALLGTLPYSVVGYTDRYAYFAAVPFFVWLAAFVEALPVPSRHLRSLPRAALLALAAAEIWMMHGVLTKWDQLGKHAHGIYEDIAAVRGQVQSPAQLRLVNMPSFCHWIVRYQLRFPSNVDLKRERYLETERVRFNPPQIELEPGEILLHYEGGRLVRRQVEDLARGRTDYPAVGFPKVLVLSPPDEHDILATVDRYEGNVAEMVVLEQLPPGLPATLSGGELLARRIDPASGTASWRVRMPSTGLAVFVLPYWPHDPLAAAIRQTGRVPAHVRAQLDGKPTQVYPAFYHFVAVVVPAGEHEVTLGKTDRS
ncbi:MAG: hypothetical protein AB1486_00400 [Planctomycetota bacterium]